ncbi:MAG: MarR family transcriptional regulator [Methylobacillus sp.]|jgi:DNA-binding MarR family transcriptional regulator|nr:MarR family transcriptional regulator [Methylobacillus sp.]
MSQDHPDPAAVLKLFRVIFQSVNRHSHEIERKAGIGGAQLWALAEIGGKPRITVSELAKAMSIHQSTASNLLDKLALQNYIVRDRGEADRRVVFLTLTPRGAELLRKAPLPHRGVLSDALFKLSETDLAALQQNLETLLAQLEFKQLKGAYEPLGKI